MTISLKTLLSSAAAFALALTASAQGTGMSSSGMTMAPASGSAYGLLGQNYIGATFAYTTLDDGPPDVAHSWGFMASRPSEVPNLDALFKYNYTSVSAYGTSGRSHDFAIGATGYVPMAGVKPFAEANIGWSFWKAGGSRIDSFTFLIGVGVEIQLAPRFVLSPYVNYSEFTKLNSESWNYGLKGTYRIAQEWSGSAAVELDDDQNVTYRFGLNRHY